jgi:hypothetical protein
MGVTGFFQQFGKREMNDGRKTLFWEDAWVNSIPLAVQFPRLYNLAFRKLLTVYQTKEEGWGVIRLGCNKTHNSIVWRNPGLVE